MGEDNVYSVTPDSSVPSDSVGSDPVTIIDNSTVIELPDGYQILDGSTIEDVNVSVAALDPITAADSNGLKAVILELLGDYSAVEVVMEYEQTNGYTGYLREIQPDYPWLVSAGIFTVVLYCLIRMGVAMLCKQ